MPVHAKIKPWDFRFKGLMHYTMCWHLTTWVNFLYASCKFLMLLQHMEITLPIITFLCIHNSTILQRFSYHFGLFVLQKLWIICSSSSTLPLYRGGSCSSILPMQVQAAVPVYSPCYLMELLRYSPYAVDSFRLSKYSISCS